MDIGYFQYSAYLNGNYVPETVHIKFNPFSHTLSFLKYKSCCSFGVYPTYITNIISSLETDLAYNYKSNISSNIQLYDIEMNTKNISIIPEIYKDQPIKDAVVLGLKLPLESMQKTIFFRDFNELAVYLKNDFMKEYKTQMMTNFIETYNLQTITSNISICDEKIKTYNDSIINYDLKFKEVRECIEELQEDNGITQMRMDDINEDIENFKNTIKSVQNDIKSNLGTNKTMINIYHIASFLTPENILNECVSFHQSNSTLCSSDMVNTIKLMLNSKKYILSKDFKNNKVNLHDVSFEYKMLTKPDDITREELLDIIFNIKNSSLI